MVARTTIPVPDVPADSEHASHSPRTSRAPHMQLHNQSVLDVFIEHRNVLEANNTGDVTEATAEESRDRYPKQLLRR